MGQERQEAPDSVNSSSDMKHLPVSITESTLNNHRDHVRTFYQHVKGTF